MSTAGINAFVEALQAMGLKAEIRGPIVIVEIEVPLGRHAGKTIWVGADPPTDFPTIPPHWIHLPEDIELDGGGKNPSELGTGWAKWSRPHKRWIDGTSGGSQWVAHARALLEQAIA